MTPAQALLIFSGTISIASVMACVALAMRCHRLQRRVAAATITARNNVERHATDLSQRLRLYAFDLADRMHPALHTTDERCNCVPPVEPLRSYHCAVKGGTVQVDGMAPRRLHGEDYPTVAAGPRVTTPRIEDEPTAVRPLPPRPGFTAG